MSTHTDFGPRMAAVIETKPDSFCNLYFFSFEVLLIITVFSSVFSKFIK